MRGSCRCTGPIGVPSLAATPWMRSGPRRRPGPAASPPEPRKAPDSAISAMIMATISSASMSSSWKMRAASFCTTSTPITSPRRWIGTPTNER